MSNNLSWILINAGFAKNISNLTAAVLEEADSYGKSTHGSRLIPKIIENLNKGLVRPDLKLSIDGSSKFYAHIDCHDSLGFASAVVSLRFCQLQAKKNGISAVILKNIDHIGSLGVYAKRAAQNKFLCLILAAGKPRIPLHGDKTPHFGTTPIAIGIPTIGSPIVVDTCLSKFSVNQVIEAMTNGEDLPDGIAIDRFGQATQCPREALEGALLPIGGAKGASLAFGLHILLHSLAQSTDSDHPVAMFMINLETTPEILNSSYRIYNNLKGSLKNKDGVRMPGGSYI